MLFKSVCIWMTFIPLAVVNAGIREFVLTPIAGEEVALTMSGIMLILLIFAVSFFSLPKTDFGSPFRYWSVGILWAILTMIFETGLGIFLKKPIHEIISNYDISTGNLWLIVVLSLIFIPGLVLVLRTRQGNLRAGR